MAAGKDQLMSQRALKSLSTTGNTGWVEQSRGKPSLDTQIVYQKVERALVLKEAKAGGLRAPD